MDIKDVYQMFEESYCYQIQNECGIAHYFVFPNGYGVKASKNVFTLGYRKDLWELTVIKIRKKEYLKDLQEVFFDENKCKILEVSDFLSEDSMLDIMKIISNLPENYEKY